MRGQHGGVRLDWIAIGIFLHVLVHGIHVSGADGGRRHAFGVGERFAGLRVRWQTHNGRFLAELFHFGGKRGFIGGVGERGDVRGAVSGFEFAAMNGDIDDLIEHLQNYERELAASHANN